MTRRAAAPARDRLGQVGVTVGPLARQRDEEHRPGATSRESTAAPRMGRLGAGEEPAAGQPDQVVGGERRLDRRVGRPAAAAVGSTSVTARSVAWAAVTGPASSAVVVGRSVSRSGVVIASVAIRRKSSNDMTGISSWPTRATVGVPSSIRIATTRSGVPVSRPMYPTNE